jgi:hypothetical protein
MPPFSQSETIQAIGTSVSCSKGVLSKAVFNINILSQKIKKKETRETMENYFNSEPDIKKFRYINSDI